MEDGSYLFTNHSKKQFTRAGISYLLNKYVEIAKKQEMAKDLENRKKAEDIKKTLEGLTLEFKVKTGEHDRVFGSISVKQIKQKLEDYNIDKNMIDMKTPLSSLGYHNVSINLYKDIKANVKVLLFK